MDDTNASFVFIPFGGGDPQNDRITNGLAYAKCKFWKKNLMIYDQLSVQDTLDIFAAADASINTRLHASIFSTITGTPFIDLIHHDKNRVFVHSIMRPQWGLDYWHFNLNSARQLLNQFLGDKRKSDQKELLQIADKNREMLKAAVSHIQL